MQHSIIRYIEVIKDNELFRIDANFFHPDYIKSENMIKYRNWDYLGSIASKIINFGAYSLTNHIEYIKGGGVPFLNVGDIYENEINVNAAKKIHEELSVKILKKSLCNENQVLLTIAGTIGNAAVVYNLPKNTNSNQAIANISISEISPFYLSVFLNSYYGKQQTARLTISSVQPNLLLTQVKNIKTFIPTVSFQKIIEKLYKDSHMKKDAVDKLYNFAEQLLLLELGLENWQPKNELSFIKDFSDTQETERFDAEYFQPKYIKIIDAIKNYNGGHDILGNFLQIKDKNFHPIKSKKYKYIELSDISSSGEIIGYTENIGKELPTRARRKINERDVMVSSIDGSLDSIAFVPKDWHGALCSTGFFVINSEIINSETLFIFMKSNIGQMQLKQNCRGAILASIRKQDFQNMIIPNIKMETQEAIKEKISAMYQTKRISKRLIEIATEGVEKAIEQNESVAEQWIRSKIEKLGVSL